MDSVSFRPSAVRSWGMAAFQRSRYRASSGSLAVRSTRAVQDDSRKFPPKNSPVVVGADAEPVSGVEPRLSKDADTENRRSHRDAGRQSGSVMSGQVGNCSLPAIRLTTPRRLARSVLVVPL